MVRAFRRAALPLLALAGVVIAASPASADTINLLRRETSQLSPSILFDSSTTIFGSDESIATLLDRDCVAIDDDVRGSWSRYGRVEWRFGRFAWEREPSNASGIVYVICVDRRGQASPGGSGMGGSVGGMMMAAALMWGRGATNPQIFDPPITASGGPQITDPQISASVNPPIIGPQISASVDLQVSDPQISAFLDPPTTDPRLVAFQDPQIADSQISSVLDPGSSPSPALSPSASFDAPVAVDPVNAPPVPEPGTWLLLGSGLAAAWRASRKSW